MGEVRWPHTAHPTARRAATAAPRRPPATITRLAHTGNHHAAARTGDTPEHDHGAGDHHDHDRGAHDQSAAHARPHDHADAYDHSRDDDHGHQHTDSHDHADKPGHAHGDGDDHGHEHRSGPLGWLGELFGGHSHGAPTADEALEGSAEGIRAVKISLVGLFVTAALQAVVVWNTGSVALLADTIHNLADALTSVPLWIAFVIGRRAPNRRYTYGYGRAEDVAGMVIVLMITLSAAVAGWESVRKLLTPEPMQHVWWVIAASIIGFIGNEAVALYRISVGRRIGSAALVADGQHARVDGLTSLAVLFGALGVLAGYPIADPLVGVLITVAILFVLRDALREVWWRLMDAVDPITGGAIGESRARVGCAGREWRAGALDWPHAARRGERRGRWLAEHDRQSRHRRADTSRDAARRAVAAHGDGPRRSLPPRRPRPPRRHESPLPVSADGHPAA